jgi:hypothetical protein
MIKATTCKWLYMSLNQPDAPPIQGYPEQLLEIWQEKLALRCNEEIGKIEPMNQ